jgi:hypothetical protein
MAVPHVVAYSIVSFEPGEDFCNEIFKGFSRLSLICLPALSFREKRENAGAPESRYAPGIFLFQQEMPGSSGEADPRFLAFGCKSGQSGECIDIPHGSPLE